MLHPYQCLLHFSRDDDGSSSILVAASGSYLHTFNVQSGVLLSTWSSNNDERPLGAHENNNKDESHLEQYNSTDETLEERPQKRPRISPVRDDSGSSTEIVVNRSEEFAPDFHRKQESNPAISKLAGTSNGQYVIAMTGEDKCVRVFELSENGILTPLSERSIYSYV